jgi:DNA invertase Pin-like site-specific DNA recombinase
VQHDQSSGYLRAPLGRSRWQEGLGIDTQLNDARALAAERGWTVVREYVDRNLTAGDPRRTRPQYNHLVADFHAGAFDALICWDLDRLTRQPRQLEDWIEAANDQQLALVTASGEVDLTTDNGRLFARIKVDFAIGEIERMGARQRRSKQARRESGKWHGGPAPYGYRAERGSLIPVPSEVGLIEQAIRRILHDRESMASIVKDWNSPTVPGGDTPKHRTRMGNHWRQPNLRSILMNRTLLGETKAGVQGDWPAIIDRRDFDRLQVLFNDPSRKVTHSPGVKGGKFAMTGGLSVCGHCGGALVSTQKRRKGERVQTNIGCLPRVNGPDPKNHPQVERKVRGAMVWQETKRVQIDHDALELFVLGQVIGRLDATPRLRQREAERDPAELERLDTIDAERAALRGRREHVLRQHELGVIKDAELVRRVEGIDGELDGLAAEYDRLLNQPVLEPALRKTGALAEAWPNWTPEKRRALLRGFIDRVVVNDWPKHISPAVPRRREESDSELRARQRAHMQRVIASRVVIQWR